MKLDSLPIIIAHRGASGYAPENTIAAILKAKELGIKWVEFDVMLSSCGQPVVIHDLRLTRTTNGEGFVSEHDFEYLKSLDAGSWFSPEYANQSIPSFEDVINLMRQQNLYAVIEIKPAPGQEVETALKVYKTLLAVWPEGFDKVIFSSFSLSSLETIRKICGKCHIGLGLHEWDTDWQLLAERLHCFSIHVYHKIVTKKKLALLKASNMLVIAYTVNKRERAETLFRWGIDGIFSDFPDQIQLH